MNNLHLSPEAQADLAAIKAYIAADLENPSAALATVTRITKTIRLLREPAYIGTPLSVIANVSGEHRYLVSGNYMIFYRVLGSEVSVDRVLYGRSNYLGILFRDLDPKEPAES